MGGPGSGRTGAGLTDPLVVRMPSDMVHALDREAQQLDVSRAELVRQILNRRLGHR